MEIVIVRREIIESLLWGNFILFIQGLRANMVRRAIDFLTLILFKHV